MASDEAHLRQNQAAYRALQTDDTFRDYFGMPQERRRPLRQLMLQWDHKWLAWNEQLRTYL